MKRNVINTILSATAAVASLVLTSGAANAEPVNGLFTDDARGDAISAIALPREIGDATLFAAPDAVLYHDHRLHFQFGTEDGIANDWTVHITNTTGRAWTNLFFVADLGAAIGNADGRVQDVNGAPGVLTDAFRIDSTGVNAPLYWESGAADGVLQPGEEWEFVVSNFNTGANSIPPTIITPGAFAGSSTLGDFGGITSGNASILGVPIPEPTTVGMFTLFALTMLVKRRPRTPARPA